MNHELPPAQKRQIVVIVCSFFLLISCGAVYAVWHRIQGPDASPEWHSVEMPREPYTVLVMGTDVMYTHVAPRRKVADHTAFGGRSDAMMLIILDPSRGTVRGINIPRDTMVDIPGYGYQKINAANAIGGPRSAVQAVSDLLGVSVDHYIVLNTQGLVDAVNEMGGVTVEVPKRLSYMDWTAKLKIDLEPGTHTLTGNQAMGFVRFRHDDLGDIGRIQRQQIFMQAALSKILNPQCWPHIPALVRIAHRSVLSDLNDAQLLQVFNLIRTVPRSEIQFAMLPGRFGPNGSWVPDEDEMTKLVARFSATPAYAASDARFEPND